MVKRLTRLRWHRRFRRGQHHVENLGQQAEEHIEEHFFKRLGRLYDIKRFISTWVILFVVLMIGVLMQASELTTYYKALKPEPGGIYTEGILGTFTNANPLYATGPVDASAAQLVFSGLMKYDSNNQLVGDLAEKLQSDDRAVTYTVTLRKDAFWHDGIPLTAEDVVFTYKTIQNPDTKSPLLPNWQGVQIVAKDMHTVVFTLPHALASFPHSLTNGIVPKHLLANIPYTQLRSISFNTAKPVGSGPFKWEKIEVHGDTPEKREEQIGLVANPQYHGGATKLNRFTIRAFHDESRMVSSFKNQELTAMAGLETTPDGIPVDPSIHTYNIPLSGEVIVFLKTTSDVLQEQRVRQALVKATDTTDIIKGLGYPVAVAKGPLLKKDIGYDPKLLQFPTNVPEAKTLLDQAGWVVGADGIRAKGSKKLSFRLFSQSTSQYSLVAQKLQAQWRQIGVDAQVILQPESDLQGTIAFHNYDALLFGIALGSDPDVFAYWHSTQADIRSANRLNFSEYKSGTTDRALEAGRARSDQQLRSAKYRPFLTAWRDDAPGIALYQPRFLYITRGQVFGFTPTTLDAGPDRFSNVNNWMIRETETAL